MRKVSARFVVCLAVPAFGQQPPAAAPPAAAPAAEEATHIRLEKSELKWGEGPASLPKGTKAAILEGDPTKAGPFTLRIQMPANYKVPPHTHPAVEHVTILEGEGYMGMGEKFDEKEAKKLTAGGFSVMPAKHAHFFFTKKKTMIQLHGIGPWGITYINPADDPRNAAAATPAAAPK